MATKTELLEKRDRHVSEMSSILAKGKLTPEDRESFDAHERDVAEIDRHLDEPKRDYATVGPVQGRMTPRGSELDLPVGAARLRPQDSIAEYAQRHNIGGVASTRGVPSDFDFNAYWGQQCGFAKPGPELRAIYGLGEDVSSGSGAGNAVVATLWAHEVVDLIRAKCWLFAAGATTVPVMSELTNFPIWEADVQPAYVAETGSVSLDTTPNIGTLQANCAGAYVDITAASLNVLEDAYNNGGINALVQNSIAQKYARLLDSVALYGQVGSTGNPGIVNEGSGPGTTGGILAQTMGADGAIPTSYADISKAAAQVREQSVEPTAVVWHPGVQAVYAQLVDTLGQPMRPTPDVANLSYFDSALLNGFVETKGSSSVTSSLYVGDFSYVHCFMRLDPAIQTAPLRERYADQQLMAWLSRMRFSVRTFHASQVICQLNGILV